MGKSIEVPELTEYLKKVGYEFVGSQYVPLIPVAPPTTQLMWLKEKKVDLALGVMINPGAQATVKEMGRLDMGPNRGCKMVFGNMSTTQIADFVSGMGDLGDGYVSGGSFPPMDELETPGVKFCNDLQNKYRPGKKVPLVTYELGMIEVMTQVEALRLALKEAPLEKLKPADVLKNGFYKMKKLDTGGLSATPLTYGPGEVPTRPCIGCADARRRRGRAIPGPAAGDPGQRGRGQRRSRRPAAGRGRRPRLRTGRAAGVPVDAGPGRDLSGLCAEIERGDGRHRRGPVGRPRGPPAARAGPPPRRALPRREATGAR